MTFAAVTSPSVGLRVTDPYRADRRSGIVRAVLGNPRYVMVLCDDDVVRTMDCHTLVTTPPRRKDMPTTETLAPVPVGCTGSRYLVNPDFPDEGTDIAHDVDTCPVHQSFLDERRGASAALHIPPGLSEDC